MKYVAEKGQNCQIDWSLVVFLISIKIKMNVFLFHDVHQNDRLAKGLYVFSFIRFYLVSGRNIFKQKLIAICKQFWII